MPPSIHLLSADARDHQSRLLKMLFPTRLKHREPDLNTCGCIPACLSTRLYASLRAHTLDCCSFHSGSISCAPAIFRKTTCQKSTTARSASLCNSRSQGGLFLFVECMHRYLSHSLSTTRSWLPSEAAAQAGREKEAAVLVCNLQAREAMALKHPVTCRCRKRMELTWWWTERWCTDWAPAYMLPQPGRI